MDGKIKMPEEMAKSLSQNIYAMEIFNSLSTEEKKIVISDCRGEIDEYIITRYHSIHSLSL